MKKCPGHVGTGPSPSLALPPCLKWATLRGPPNRRASTWGNPTDTEMEGGWAGWEGSFNKDMEAGKPCDIWEAGPKGQPGREAEA